MAYNKEYNTTYFLRGVTVLSYLLCLVAFGAFVSCPFWLSDRRSEAAIPQEVIFHLSATEKATIAVPAEIQALRNEVKLLREAVERAFGQPEVRKTWKQVREPVQLEGGIDDGYELVEETIPDLQD